MNLSPDVADHPARVLIVDDEPYNRQLLVAMLTPEGYALQTAASGEEALAMVARERPDLILLDIMMPGMDGYHVVAKIKDNPETKHIPVIMVTALDDRTARMLALSAGAEDLLTKPVDRAEMSVRVRNLLRLKAYGDYYGKYSELLEGKVTSRTAELVERTKTLERQAAVLTEQAALLDLAPDAIVVRDMQNRIVFWNRGAEVIYGWLSKEALGRDTRELLKTDFSGRIKAEILRQGQWEGEVIHYTRDGRELILASRWTMQRDANGVPVRILTISNDITTRKQAVKALEELSQRTQRRERILTTTLSFISDFAYIYDREGRFLFANQPLLDLWGITLEEAVGKTFFELEYPDDLAEKLHQQVQKVFETKKSLTDETLYKSPDGLDGYYEYIFSPVLGADDRVEFVVGCTRDITGRKRAEVELRAAKEVAEAANKSKSQFLANMSHEIRTPMNGVMGMTDLVLDTELTAGQREHLGIVKSSADDLLTIINDILDFSRIEARKLELDLIDFNPHDVIGDTAKALALRAEQKGLELIVDVGPEVPYRLRGDPGRLRQILINLFGNAIKFTHQGEIILRVTRDASTPSNEVVLQFSVTDTGIGVPYDRQKSIFEPFTQADGSMTRTYGGTGLGLTISAQLVQLMGGRLWVESEAGKGSTFHFMARFETVNAPVVAAAIPDAVDLRDMHVLVVDDNATNQRLLGQFLLAWGMVPTLAAGVSEALTALRAAQESGSAFPLLITDYQMPDVDGFMLAEIIKQDPALADITIVMLTSAGQPGDAARRRESGITAFLPKPIKRSELHDVIQSALIPRGITHDRVALVPRQRLGRARQTGRILVVEDNKVNQLVARRLLEKRGHSVVVANNGWEALAILDDATSVGFDCVLMDVQMPELDGIECTAIIRDKERASGFHLPIIAMTAHAMEGDDARYMAAGMDAYLSKPFERDLFFDVVERHLSLASSAVSRLAFPLPIG